MRDIEIALGIVIAFFVLAILTVGCGTTKKFYRDCDKVENGWVCEE